ncbi:hypothetical protein PtrV1_04102 [Pyrenophora tritici-repentis]|nr:hypothetical protein PtrV1_04102 [Pyrenophora tritici-repentis]KAI1570407.1 Prothymosin domain containing protein [Pyrenophora tritici-repentis]
MDEPASTAESTPPTTLAETADLLRKERTRFLNKVPVDLNSTLCYPPDRSAVILVYDTALSRISANNHLNIYVEAKSKINIIIGLNKVRCTDPAFKQGILPPLEPMYAGPRIEYNKDPYGRHAQWRLNAWRKDRWPLFLPVEAMKPRLSLLEISTPTFNSTMGSENEDRRSTRKQSKLTSSPTLLPVHEEEVMEDISVHEEEVMEEIFPELDGEVTFEYDSPTGLDAEELNALFKLPPRPKNDPRDLASLKTEGIAKSFMWLGIKPKLGLPYDLVHGMEQQQAKDAKKLEKQNDMYDELDEGEQQAKATEEDDETIEARPGKRQKKAMEDDDEAGTKATEDDDESDEARPAKRQTK